MDFFLIIIYFVQGEHDFFFFLVGFGHLETSTRSFHFKKNVSFWNFLNYD